MVYRDPVSGPGNPPGSEESASRPARRRLAPDDRRQALINSALRLFNARPYDEVSVDDIAADAGMSRALVYHYCGGKAGVFATALRLAGRRAGRVLRSSPGQPDRPHRPAAARVAGRRGGPPGPG